MSSTSLLLAVLLSSGEPLASVDEVPEATDDLDLLLCIAIEEAGLRAFAVVVMRSDASDGDSGIIPEMGRSGLRTGMGGAAVVGRMADDDETDDRGRALTARLRPGAYVSTMSAPGGSG